ncbi:MAG: hypothetical protein ABI234_18525 [Ktedonobacteraceae bacterium]
MSQYKRLIQLPLVGMILLCLLATMFFAAKKRSTKPDPEKHTVGTHPDDVRKYWTNDRMRKAKPAPMPSTDDLKPGKERPRHPSV